MAGKKWTSKRRKKYKATIAARSPRQEYGAYLASRPRRPTKKTRHRIVVVTGKQARFIEDLISAVFQHGRKPPTF